MPDGQPQSPPQGPRYDDDFFAWTQFQAEVLRSLATSDSRFDREHIAEEIEDLGKSERNAVRSEVRRILEHFLKLAYSPAAEPRSDWMVSIATARAELQDKLTSTLRADAVAVLPALYDRAKRIAGVGMVKYGEEDAALRFPPACPFSFEQILADDWYPEPPEEGR